MTSHMCPLSCGQLQQTAYAREMGSIRSRQKKYGLTEKEYRALLSAQHGVCALCRQRETSRHKSTLRALAVDHDHTTGKVRGLLCATCNAAVGYLEKLGMVWAQKAQAYVMAHAASDGAREAVVHVEDIAGLDIGHALAVRQMVHIEKRWLEAIRRQAVRDDWTYTQVINAAFRQYFQAPP